MKTNQSGSLRNRKTSGFTIAEMLIAVAILVILMAVSFIGVINYQRTLKQHELDGTARELFIAAQNHLTMAQSQGLLKDAYAQSAQSTGDPSVEDPSVEDPSGEESSVEDSSVVGAKGSKDGKNSAIRYWYVGEDKSLLTDSSARPNTLYEMLPFGSIDDTVRLGGSYVIRYDLASARVLDVFYSDLQRLSEHEFTSGDYETLFPGLVGEDNKDKRLHVQAFDDQVIGWYGGDDVDPKAYATLFAPALKITNAERLTVTATFDFGSYSKNSAVTNTQMKIIMRGDTSEVEREVGDSVKMTDITNEYSITRVLDDITVAGGQFKSKWCSESDTTTTKNLIPGENVSIYAVVFTNSELASIAKSSTKHTNSLFANMINEKNPDGSVRDRIGTISNIRHLENLDATISGYDLEALGVDGTTKFKQVSDLRWKADGAKKPIAFTSAIVEGTTTPASDVKVYRLSDTDATAQSYFASVTPCKVTATGTANYALNYDGNGKKISNVEIKSTGDAGIFATLPSGSTVKSLELVDCSVETTGGNAGTLVGSGIGTLTIQDVLVHDSTGKVQSKVKSNAGTAPASTQYGWSAGADGFASGGLAGSLACMGSAGITVDGCGASVFVEANGNSCAAGGLLGYCQGTVSVTNSYAGAHTKEGTGQYDNEKFNVVAKDGSQIMAGGLVGFVLMNTTVAHCYATTSVSCVSTATNALDTYAGGLVGSAQAYGNVNPVISDCYATGLIGPNPNNTYCGAFVGFASDGTTVSGSQYYEIINGDLKPIGNKEPAETTSVTPLDKDTGTFNKFCSENRSASDSVDKAIPYDSALVTHYNGIYPLQTIKMLNPDATGIWTTSHYGDWPMPEAMFINTPSS